MPYWLLLIELYWCYRMGCVFLWIHFTVIHNFQSNFRSVLKWLRHMNDLSVFRYWFFFHSISDIRLQYLRALYSNGLARYPSPWLVRGYDTCQVGFAFVPRLVLVLQTPLFRVIPRSYGRKDKCGTFSRVLSWVGCFSGGVVVVSLALFDLSFGPLPNKQLLITQ